MREQLFGVRVARRYALRKTSCCLTLWLSLGSASTQMIAAALIRDGIRIYIEELREDGRPIPESMTTAQRISVAA
jgi:hypothetical protein